MGKGKLKKPDVNTGSKLNAPSEINITDFKHPIFCLKWLHRDYSLAQCTPIEKINFIERLALLSTMTWEQIQLANRHGLGSEKIAKSAIKPEKPKTLTDDVDFLLAFRFDGLKPFVGHRNRFILHILYIDRDFAVYDH